LTLPPDDLPPEAAARLTSGAFSSGLSVNDFAACLHMGMRPVALVQGYCVMRWSWYGAGAGGGYGPGYGRYGGGYGRGGGYPGTVGGGFGGAFARAPSGALSTYQCPHYYAGADHRAWGQNVEQSWMTRTWHDGFNTAYLRMISEAEQAGAHGVVGVVDTSSVLIDRSIREFHIYGTGVVVEGEPRPERIWTSYLAGPRLEKLIETGFMPTSIVASMASVRAWAVCVTQTLMRGGYGSGGGAPVGAEITQMADAQMQARRLARDQVKAGLGRDNLHGADLQVGVHEMGEGDIEVDCVLRGTRVHRFRPADPLPPPQLIVRAND
jgi:hypothetical protein